MLIKQRHAESYSSLRLAKDCLLYYYHQYRLKDLKFVPSPVLQRGKKIHSELERAVKNKKPPLDVWTPSGLMEKLWDLNAEAEVGLAVSRKLEPVDFWDARALCRGRADVKYIEDGQLCYVDWKTGQLRVDKYQAEVTHFVSVPGGPPIKFTWVFVDQEEVKEEIITSKSDIQVVKDLIWIEEEDDFEPTRCWRCKFCPVPPKDCPIKEY